MEAVGGRAGEGAEQERGQQRGDPDARDRVTLGRHASALGDLECQRGERENAEPIPQAGQRERDPQPAERLYAQHAAPLWVSWSAEYPAATVSGTSQRDRWFRRASA